MVYVNKRDITGHHTLPILKIDLPAVLRSGQRIVNWILELVLVEYNTLCFSCLCTDYFASALFRQFLSNAFQCSCCIDGRL